MANLAQSAVSFGRMWTEGGVTGKQLSARLVTLTLTGQGTTTNTIPASVLALTVIEQATDFVYSDNSKIARATPSADGSVLLLGLVASDAPVDITATITGVVKGYL